MKFGSVCFLQSRRVLAMLGIASAASALACAREPAPPAPVAIAVEGMDYAFQLPETLTAGPSTIRLHNAGKVSHEMGIALLKSGVTMQQLMDRVQSGASPDSLVEGVVGILIAAPGETTLGALSVDLRAGRTYTLFCNFQDGPDKPPHLALGMFAGRTILAAQP